MAVAAGEDGAVREAIRPTRIRSCAAILYGGRVGYRSEVSMRGRRTQLPAAALRRQRSTSDHDKDVEGEAASEGLRTAARLSALSRK